MGCHRETAQLEVGMGVDQHLPRSASLTFPFKGKDGMGMGFPRDTGKIEARIGVATLARKPAPTQIASACSTINCTRDAPFQASSARR